jgi:radical SAM protein with 4Fe4S-binding SPASM domain
MTPKNDGNLSPLELQLQRPAMIELMKGDDELAQLLAPPPAEEGPGPCAAGRSYCGVSPTGDVVACIMMPLPVGNIRQRAFRDIWLGSPFLDEVRAISTETLSTCNTCDVKGACSRCTGMAVMRGQGINGCDLSAKPVASARIAAHRLRVIQ